MNVIERRWENEIPHHPLAVKIIRGMSKLDVDDVCNLCFGGDGDHGEDLLFLLSEWIEKNHKLLKAEVKNL